jgi:hypothetical protein
MSRAAFTAEAVLAQLDACAEAIEFPMLNNLYTDLGDVRLSAYGDERRWAILIDVICLFNRGSPPGDILDILHHMGNCVRGELGATNDDFLNVLHYDGADLEEGEEGAFGFIPDRIQFITIRGHRLPVPRDPARFAAKGIEQADPPHLHGAELLRALLPEQRHLLLATEDELRRRIPRDLPLLLRLDEWYHPDVADDELPSETPTFQGIAEVLVWGDGNRYRPPAKPNTHWKNWPRGGTL